MCGTLVCGVDDREDGDRALETAVELSDRLGLRLVLAHVEGGIEPTAADGDGAGAVSITASRERAAGLLARLALEHGVADRAETRFGTGDAALAIGRIAAEEAADLIVVGSRSGGWLRRRFDSRLAEELGSETRVPVLVVPPDARRTGRMAA